MTSPLDIINETLDTVSGALRDLGIEVSAFTSQLLMLLLIAVILAVMRKKFIPLANLDGKGAATIAAPVLIGLGILASWTDQYLNPPEKFVVAGIIQAQNTNGLVLDLLSFEGGEMQAGTPQIETPSGEFFARYDYGLTRYPRHIRVSQLGCDNTLVPVSLAQLRAGHDFQILHRCEHND